MQKSKENRSGGLFSFNIPCPVIDDWVDRNRNNARTRRGHGAVFSDYDKNFIILISGTTRYDTRDKQQFDVLLLFQAYYKPVRGRSECLLNPIISRVPIERGEIPFVYVRKTYTIK